MPTIMTHAVVGAALAYAITPSKPLIATAAVVAMLPDIDVLAFPLGISYGDILGHRGLTHSIAFATTTAAIAALFFRTRLAFLVVLLATLSHGALDAFTNGGLGVAFFAPFSPERYFAPWTPIEVSPIGPRFFSPRGLSVLASEFLWVWLPTSAIMLATKQSRDRQRAD